MDAMSSVNIHKLIMGHCGLHKCCCRKIQRLSDYDEQQKRWTNGLHITPPSKYHMNVMDCPNWNHILSSVWKRDFEMSILASQPQKCREAHQKGGE